MNALVWLVIGVTGAVYVIGLAHMWTVAGTGRLVPADRAAVFLGALVMLAVALGPPMDSYADRNLAWHMVQHIILIWVAAPMLVLGAPLPTMLWALPDRERVVAHRWWRRLHRSIAGDRWPLWVGATLAVSSVTMLAWHLPVLFQAAVRNDAVHATEHASFLLTSAALWWTLLGAVKRLRMGPAVMVVFVAKLPALLLGVGMTFASAVWYPIYGTGAHGLHEQQYGGVVMWVAGGTIATGFALALLGMWLVALERSSPANIPVAHEVLP